MKQHISLEQLWKTRTETQCEFRVTSSYDSFYYQIIRREAESSSYSAKTMMKIVADVIFWLISWLLWQSPLTKDQYINNTEIKWFHVEWLNQLSVSSCLISVMSLVVLTAERLKFVVRRLPVISVSWYKDDVMSSERRLEFK